MNPPRRGKKSTADYSQVYVTSLEDFDDDFEEIPQKSAPNTSSTTNGHKQNSNGTGNSHLDSSPSEKSNLNVKGRPINHNERTTNANESDIVKETCAEKNPANDNISDDVKESKLSKDSGKSEKSKPGFFASLVPPPKNRNIAKTNSERHDPLAGSRLDSKGQGQFSVRGQIQPSVKGHSSIGQIKKVNQKSRLDKNKKGYGHEEHDLVVDELEFD